MTIAVVNANRGSGSEKVSDTTFAISPSANMAAGNYGICVAFCDNIGTDEGQTTDLSITDSQGHTWTRAREQTESGGAAAAGITGGVFFALLTNGLTTSDSVTMTVASAVTAKCLALAEFSVGGGNTLSVAGHNGTNASAATSYSVTVGSLSNVEHLWIGVDAAEEELAASCAKDAAFTQLITSDVPNTGQGGANLTNLRSDNGYLIETGTTQTWDVASGLTSTDRVDILVAFEEVTAAAPGPPDLRRHTPHHALLSHDGFGIGGWS